MKRKLYLLLCIVIIIVMSFSLVACKSDEVSGLGKLTMGDKPKTSEGIGTLGEPGTSTSPNTPQQTPNTPQQTPSSSGMSTEKYECSAFNVTIPKGWQVKYDIFDAGTGTNHIIISITDPADSNNSIFFLTALEPFFTSAAAKSACLPYVASYYQWAPIMTGTPSAEATLKLWPNIFTVLQAEGLGYDVYFKNYNVKTVLGSEVAAGSTNTDMTSSVTASVSIPGATKLYQMYFQNNLVLADPASGLPKAATYYRSYTNYGAVLREDLADQYASLIQCMQSFQFKTS